jgi:hypothetical protein
MIFKQFEEADIVAGRVTRVSSGFWLNGSATAEQSLFEDDFYSLTTVDTPSPSYGVSVYDVRRTMYYLNVFPTATEKTNNDPYFSITYGNFYGNLGSGSFGTETSSIYANPTKEIYTQYQNILLGTADLDGRFTMKSGSTTVNADDIWVITFSTYKMKDRIDEGLIELSFSGSTNGITLIDDSYYTTQAQSSYQIIEGTLENQPSPPIYGGFGILYPQNGMVVLNAARLSEKLGLWNSTTKTSTGTVNGWDYNPGLSSGEFTYNHKTLFESMKLCVNNTAKVRKSEYVPARHYFVRIKNRDFNYSNNPTYVYDGSDGIHAKGTIRNTDFIENPQTYITTIGLYNESNELVAVAKLSRPAVKTFSDELLCKVRLDF